MCDFFDGSRGPDTGGSGWRTQELHHRSVIVSHGLPVRRMAMLLEQPGRIPNHSYAGRNGTGDDCTHADHGVRPDNYRLIWAAVPNYRASANVGAVLDHYITVADYVRRKCDVVTNHTVMGHITVIVALKLLPDPRVPQDQGKMTQDETFLY